jgi:uncharacterized protein YndB with AHSA1/START domain
MTDRIESHTDQIDRELLLPADPEEVWAVVTGAGWLADDVALELVPGGEASFTTGASIRDGWVEEARAPDPDSMDDARLVFWWAAPGEVATRVELTLEPQADGQTLLRVSESRPLDVLDVVGIPLRDTGTTNNGPVLLAAA